MKLVFAASLVSAIVCLSSFQAIAIDLCRSRQIDSGYGNTCLVNTDNKVQCFGSNAYGQSSSPVFLGAAALNSWLELSVGESHTCGLRTGYVLQCWGNAAGNRVEVPIPDDWELQSKGGFQWKTINLGSTFSCGILDETRKWWLSTEVRDFTDAITGSTFKIRWWDSSRLTRAKSGITPPTNSTLLCWGDMQGFPIIFDDFLDPNHQNLASPRFPVSDDWMMVSSGAMHACAIFNNRTMQCFGDNQYGQIKIPGSASHKYKYVSAGASHTCAIDCENRILCFGSNTAGQSKVPCDAFWISVEAGAQHSCGILSDHTMRCWGGNDFGQSTIPKANDGQEITDWIRISVGRSHTCGVRSDRSVQCWGSNVHGETAVPANFKLATCPENQGYTTQQALVAC